MDIKSAIDKVIASASNSRVKEYTNSFDEENLGIAVVIQLFVKPEYAGVIFTSDIITGSSAYIQGNYVKGEALVSGAKNAVSFKINAVKYRYEGHQEIKKYARKLYRFCNQIKNLYNMPIMKCLFFRLDRLLHLNVLIQLPTGLMEVCQIISF